MLPINAFLLMSEEPVLVDTGLGMDSPEFIDAVHVGDRTLTAVAPPLFDDPMSTGFIDRSTVALFTVDALQRTAARSDAERERRRTRSARRRHGRLGYQRLALGPHHRQGQVRRGAGASAPARAESHLLLAPPAADGTSMDEFIKILAMVPDAEAHQPPNAEQFGQIIEAMTAAQQPAASPSSAPTSPPSHRSRLPDRVLASARGSRLRPWSRQPCRSEPASS